VKAKLATDVGVSTAASVDVDSTGQVVTLRGTVDSEEQKQQAEQAVMQVNGVTKVINLLQVKP
jgi:osmotically-inducible protein OsmY